MRSVVLADDVVPGRATPTLCGFSGEVSESKEHWTGTLQRELDDVKRRALGLWAPKRRSTAMDVDSIAQSLDSTSISPDAKDAKQAIASSGAGRKRKQPPRAGKSPDTTQPQQRQTKVCRCASLPKKQKVSRHRQLREAAADKRRAMPALSMPRLSPILNLWFHPGNRTHIYSKWSAPRVARRPHVAWVPTDRGVSAYASRPPQDTDPHRSARRACCPGGGKRTKNRPAPWQRAPPMGPILCSVCGYSVAWASNSDNALEQSRALRHCYACGRIVCVGMRKQQAEPAIARHHHSCEGL